MLAGMTLAFCYIYVEKYISFESRTCVYFIDHVCDWVWKESMYSRNIAKNYDDR